MEAGRITIYHADDNDRGAKFESFVVGLLTYFGLEVPGDALLPDALDSERCLEALSEYVDYRPSAPDFYEPSYNFDEVMAHITSGELADIYVLDMRWVMLDGSAFDDGGKRLHDALKLRRAPVEIFSNTAYEGKVLQNVYRENMTDRIGIIPHPVSLDILKAQLPITFERVARRILRRASFAEREAIRGAVDAAAGDEALLEQEVSVGGQTWKIKRLFLFCFDPDTRTFERVRERVKELAGPNLTAAAAECFGVGGVKQATHPKVNGYCESGWHECMLHQLKTFLDALDEAIPRATELTSLAEFRTRVDEFYRLAVEIGDDHPGAEERLTPLRNSHFRFGTNLTSQNVAFDGVPLDASSQWSMDDFEINLPVHEFYAEAFKLLAARSVLATCYSHEVALPAAHGFTFKELKRPRFFKNYLIFGHSGTSKFEDRVPLTKSVDYLEAFSASGFRYFGVLYFLVRRVGGWRLYDCTGEPVLEKGLDEIESKLLERLQSLDEFNAYTVMEFVGWRQP